MVAPERMAFAHVSDAAPLVQARPERSAVDREGHPAGGTSPRPAPVPAAERERLVEGARRRGFYPLVQLLERLGGGAPVGTSNSPSEESVKFRHDPSLAFSTADVVSVVPLLEGVQEGAPGVAFEVTTSFLGLTGSAGSLPHYIAEEVVQEDAARLRTFLDLFHHRLISFFYRARARCDVPAGWRSDLADAWSPRMLALVGLDALLPLPGGGGMAAWRFLRLAPLLAEREVTAHALETALADLLEEDLGGASAAVEPFAGSWVDIAEPDRNSLGRGASRLGVDLVLGRRVVDVAGRFRVVFGPLSEEAYRRFAAGEPVRRAEEAIAALVAEPIEHEIVLWLAADAAPAVRLGSSRIGKDCWLGGQRRQTRIRVAGPP